MTATDHPALTIADAASELRSGATTSTELVTEAIRRADALDDELGVYVTRFDESALAAAARADADFAGGVDRGLLQGIPIAVKDLIAVSEGPTTAQSVVLDPEWGAKRDAPVIERLKSAGAVITGKLTMSEFACGGPDAAMPFPVPRNPWDRSTFPGSSSSGAGNGVAAGLFLAGIGTDTGGSIRMPAAFCGVTGLKPTYGRVPKAGCVPLGYSLDHIGPLARSAYDCGAVLAAIAGHDPRDPTSSDHPVGDILARTGTTLTGLRVGVDRVKPFDHELTDPGIIPVFEDALATLSRLGTAITDVSLPWYSEARTANVVTLFSEAFAYHRNDLVARWDDYGASCRATLAMGAMYSAADYVQAQRVRRVVQRVVADLFTRVDLILTPTTVTGAPTYAQFEENHLTRLHGTLNTMYWSAIGYPVLVVPMGFDARGLPLSLQIAARPFEEGLLVQVGDAYQKATDWHVREPL